MNAEIPSFSSPVSPSADDLRAAWEAAKAGPGPARARDVAASLGASEAALAAARVGDDVIRLSGDWKRLLTELHAVGRLMGLTRNDHAVIEREGAYEPASFVHGGAVGLVLDEGIDLRLFMSRWHHAFAIAHETPKGQRWGIHFFDAAGDAVHKVYLTEGSDAEAFWAIVDSFRASSQAAPLHFLPREAPAVERPDEEIDVAGLQAAWRALEDTHDFVPLLRRFGVTRTQALRLAPEEAVRVVRPTSLATTLEQAAETELPIMVFVGNAGCIQIHTGPVHRIKRLGPWLNVLDPGFNLHVRDDRIEAAWVVEKPTRDGVVTSLELFDGAGETVAMLFGKRKPGQPEDLRWRTLASQLA